MNTLYELLTTQYSDQGLKNIKVYYDSLFLILKYKSGSSYYDVVVVEKIDFDYSKGTINKHKNLLSINFGDTENSSPFSCNGTCFIDSFLNRKKKTVILTGLKKTCNERFIPVIYEYDINHHETKLLYPSLDDEENFDTLSLEDFKTTEFPICRYIDDKLFYVFQTKDSDFNYVHKITYDFSRKLPVLEDYEKTKYETHLDLSFSNAETDILNFKYNDYHGVVSKYATDESVEDYLLLSLDDGFDSILSLDGVSVLGLDL